MHPKICLMVCIWFLFNFATPIEVPEQNLEAYTTFNGFTNVIISGAESQTLEKTGREVCLVEIGNIPLRKQINNSCATTSFAMLIDYLNMPYRSQEYYDKCANRQKNKGTKLEQLKMCGNKLGVRTILNLDYDIIKLKTGDIVVYHSKGYNNNSDLHGSVVDIIDNETIRLANPWNSYDEYTINEFKEIYTKEVLILLK